MWHQTGIKFSCKQKDINIYRHNTASVILFEFGCKWTSAMSPVFRPSSSRRRSTQSVCVCVCRQTLIIFLGFSLRQIFSESAWGAIIFVRSVCWLRWSEAGGGGKENIAAQDRQPQHCADCHFLSCDYQWSFSGFKKKKRTSTPTACLVLILLRRQWKPYPSRVTMPTLKRLSGTCCGNSEPHWALNLDIKML